MVGLGTFQLQYSCLRPSQCIAVKPVMSSLCWPMCLTEGPLLHVPWGSFRALSSKLTTFLPCSEGLTVLLGLNEEEFALPWQKISHSPWQLWQPIMAACWWEVCNPLFLPLPPLSSPALRSSSSVLHLEHLISHILLFFLLTLRTTKWKYKIHASLAERGTREQDLLRQSTNRAEWQEVVEKHIRQFRNLYSICPPSGNPNYTSGIPFFFWLTHHVKLISTNLSPPADRMGEMERQVTPCTTVSEPCSRSHCLLVLFSGVALHFISKAL